MKPRHDIQNSVRQHRLLLGMTQQELADRAAVTRQTILSIEKGKYADFFLVPGDPTRSLKELRQIRMVVSDGVVYFPSEIYPWFGIRPFSEIPQVTGVVDTSVPGTATGN